MQIEITAKGLEITDALRNIVQEKFSQHFKSHMHILRIHVVLEVHKQNQIVKVHFHIPGADIHATAESKQMYDSIDTVINKLTAQIHSHKSKATDHHSHDEVEQKNEEK